VDTSGRLYADFIPLFFLQTHRETSALANELTEASDQFRFLDTTCLPNLKGSVGFVLIMVKASVMRIYIPLDLSSRSFIPLPRFIRSCHPTSLLTSSLVVFPFPNFSVSLTLFAHHSFGVTFFPPLAPRLFLFCHK
jgi:hypothetical protein